MVRWCVTIAIENNPKRVDKIRNARVRSRHYGKRDAMLEKARAFVVAECREQHIKLSAQDIYDTAFETYYRLER